MYPVSGQASAEVDVDYYPSELRQSCGLTDRRKTEVNLIRSFTAVVQQGGIDYSIQCAI